MEKINKKSHRLTTGGRNCTTAFRLFVSIHARLAAGDLVERSRPNNAAHFSASAAPCQVLFFGRWRTAGKNPQHRTVYLPSPAHAP